MTIVEKWVLRKKISVLMHKTRSSIRKIPSPTAQVKAALSGFLQTSKLKSPIQKSS